MYVDENGEFIITAIIVGAIVGAVVGAYIGGSQANGTYNPFRWDYSSGNTWLGIGGGALIGGVSGALTPKGHNIWTGREIPQPVQTLETTPMGVHLDVENNITGNLELKAPTTNSVLDLQQPKLIPIETPDGGVRLVSVENISTKSLNPTHYITKSKSQMQALLNDIRTNGIQEPIKYVKYNGVKYIVDGHHRFFIAQKLGIQNIPAQQVQLPYQGYKTFQDLIIDTGKQPGFWKFMK